MSVWGEIGIYRYLLATYIILFPISKLVLDSMYCRAWFSNFFSVDLHSEKEAIIEGHQLLECQMHISTKAVNTYPIMTRRMQSEIQICLQTGKFNHSNVCFTSFSFQKRSILFLKKNVGMYYLERNIFPKKFIFMTLKCSHILMCD